MPTRERRAVALLAVLLCRGVTVLPVVAQPTFKVGAIPDQNPERLNRLYGQLADELSERLDVKVRYVPVSNYPAAVSAFRSGGLDLAWFGGLTGVQARLQTPGAQVLAQRDIDARFRSVFIANTNSGLQPITSINGLTSLRGKRFSFGSESSTSGRLMPQHFLAKAGVTPSQFSGGRAGFSGSHDATIAVVQSGAYEAGALNEQVWTSAVNDGRVNTEKVEVIWRTPEYVDYHWVVRPNLDQRFGAGFTGRLRQAILAIQPTTPRQTTILELFAAERFLPAEASQYEPIERVGRELGKIR